MSRRSGLLLALAVLLVAALLVTRFAGGAPPCPVVLDAVGADQPALVPAADLVPAGTVGDERRPVVEAVSGILGEVVSGRFYESGVPALVPLGDHLGLAAGTSVRAVTLPDGEHRWGWEYDGEAARGGMVGESFVLLVGGDEPAVVSIDAGDGDLTGCVEAPHRGTGTLLTDQAGEDVVVAAGAPGDGVTLSRVAPAADEVRWERAVGELPATGGVTVAGAAVLVSQVAGDPVRLAEAALGPPGAQPAVAAYSLDDGAPTWTFPSEGAATVAGHEPASGTTYTVTMRRGAGKDPRDVVAGVAALDGEGRTRWQRHLGEGFWSGSLWGDVFVAQGPGPGGATLIRGYVDGRRVWTLDSRAFPGLGLQPRPAFGAAVEVAGRYLLPAPNGVVAVDPRTGRATRLDSTEPIEQLLPVGEHVVVRTRTALLVVRAGP